MSSQGDHENIYQCLKLTLKGPDEYIQSHKRVTYMFPERGRMCVGLVAASHLAVVRLVAGVDVRVLLSITGVGKPSVAAIKLTFEWFLT